MIRLFKRHGAVLAVLAFCLCALSCAGQSGQTDGTSQETDGVTQAQSAETENGAQDDITDAFLQINGVYAVDDDSAVIGGECTHGASVTAEGSYGQFTAQSRNGVFFVTVRANERKTTEYTVRCGDKSQTVQVCAAGPAEKVDFYADEYSRLFLKSHVDDFTGAGALSDNTLNYLVRQLKERNDKVNDAGGKLIVAIVPTPLTLYGEDAPMWIEKTGPSPREQLMDAIASDNAKGDLCVIDLTDTLMEAKDDGYPLTYQTDTHWTEYAAFRSYEVIHSVIKADDPDIPTHTVDDFTIEKHVCVAGNFIDAGKEAYGETAYFLTPKFNGNPLYEKVRPYALQGAHIRTAYTVTTENEELPVCLFVRDSFSTGIMKFLCDDFSCVYMQEMWEHAINDELLQEKKPNYVIHLLSEANIKEILK